MPTNKILNSKRPNVSGLLTYTGIGSAALLAGLPVLFTLGPVFSSPNVSAEEAASKSDGGVMALSVGSALAITAQDITIAATPTVGNDFYTATSTVNVRNTGSGGGYHLVMSSTGGALTNTADANKKVNTFTGYSKTGTEMKKASNSSWGYTMQSVSGTNTKVVENSSADVQNTYYPIPTAATQWNDTAVEGSKYAYLKNTTDYTNTTTGDDTVVGFGFAIGPSTVAGTYKDTITYTVVANKDNRTLFDMVNMQDLAKYPSACFNTPTPAVRTGNTAATAVTAKMTSLAGYSAGQTGVDKIPTKSLVDSRDTANSYEVRKLADGNCWMTSSLKIAGKKLTPADSNVSADYSVPEAITTAGVDALKGDDKAKKAVFTGGANGTYLYTFQVATADKGAALGTDTEGHDKIENSPDDICPKGWHLPNNTGNASWQKLLRKGQGVYEIVTDSNGYDASKVNWGAYGSATAAGINTATQNPLGLQLTDFLINSGSLAHTPYGKYWTRTANSATSAYGLGYNGSNVYPQGYNTKYYGIAVRCVSE